MVDRHGYGDEDLSYTDIMRVVDVTNSLHARPVLVGRNISVGK